MSSALPAPPVVAPPRPDRTRLRLVPAPRSQPPEGERPADDPLAGPPTGYVQGALPLRFRLPGGLPAVPEPAADLRLLPPRCLAPADPDDAPEATGRAALPDPRLWAARLGQAVLEVAAVGRPVSQLMRWTSEAVYDELLDRYAPRARQDLARRRLVVDERVRSVHVCEPADGVAEATVVVGGGPRARALALRLEGWDGRWVCTVCEWL